MQDRCGTGGYGCDCTATVVRSIPLSEMNYYASKNSVESSERRVLTLSVKIQNIIPTPRSGAYLNCLNFNMNSS